MEFDQAAYEGLTYNYWYAYNPAYNKQYSVCDDSIDTFDAPQDVNPLKNPIPFPSGTFDLGNRIDGEKNCKYVGTADTPGTLECDGLNAECFQDLQFGQNYTCILDDGSTDQIFFKLECSW